MQLVHEAIDTALANLIATDAAFDPEAVWIGIFSAITDNGVDTVIGDLVMEADADYPRQTLDAWGTPYRLSNGSPVAEAGPFHFAPPDADHPTVVAGYALFDAVTAGNLVGYVILDEPVALNVPTDNFSVIVRLQLPASGDYSRDVTYNG